MPVTLRLVASSLLSTLSLEPCKHSRTYITLEEPRFYISCHFVWSTVNCTGNIVTRTQYLARITSANSWRFFIPLTVCRISWFVVFVFSDRFRTVLLLLHHSNLLAIFLHGDRDRILHASSKSVFFKDSPKAWDLRLPNFLKCMFGVKIIFTHELMCVRRFKANHCYWHIFLYGSLNIILCKI